AGDDELVIRNGAVINGSISGGAGLDTRVYDLTGNASVGALQEFEGLTKRNTGTLTLTGPDVTTDLEIIAVEGGTLEIAGPSSVVGVNTVTVAADTTLVVDGSLSFTMGADAFTVGGEVSGLGTIDLLDGDDHLTLLDGADLSGFAAVLDGGAGNDRLTVNVASTVALGGANGLATVVKQGSGTLEIAAPGTPAFDTVLVQGGLLDVSAGAALETQSATVEAGATLNVDGDLLFTTGADTFTVAGTV